MMDIEDQFEEEALLLEEVCHDGSDEIGGQRDEHGQDKEEPEDNASATLNC